VVVGHVVSEARTIIAGILAAALEGAPAPEPPLRRARELTRPTQRAARARAARDVRDARADARERLEARVSRECARRGEAYLPPPRIPSRTWAMAQAVVSDRSGATATSALATLPSTVRARARAALGACRELVARYRAAMLVALHQLARPSRARRSRGAVVAGFCRSALARLLRAPDDGRGLSVSRVYGRAIHAAPVVPWLVDADLIAREQPGRGARGVPRGPSGYALAVYYVDAEQLAALELPALELPAPSAWLGTLVELPPVPT